MATTPIPRDFSDFLKLLNSNRARYLLIGGYAVNYYGYSRPTGDLDVWVAHDEENAERLAQAVRSFGFSSSAAEMFNKPNKIIRMGMPPYRIEMLTTISGVEFEASYSRRRMVVIGDLEIPVIDLEDLKTNKLASGRHKDLADLEEI